MALCSESRGMIELRVIEFLNVGFATRDSLLPRRSVFLALRVACVGAIPDVPGRTFTMMSASRRAANLRSSLFPCFEVRTVFLEETLNFWLCCFRSFSFVLAVKPISLKWFLYFPKRSKVCVPSEPVEPNTIIFFIVKWIFCATCVLLL